MNTPDFNTQAVTHAAVAVLVQADGQVLMGQRPEGKAWAGWWEFPGGKVEAGELPSDALVRELHEELGIDVEQAYPWLTRQFDYPEKTVKLHFFMVRAWRGEPYGKEGQLLLWQQPSAVTVSPILPANAPILKALQLPSIYATTNLKALGEMVFFEQLMLALNNGLGLIQVDEPHLDNHALQAFAARVLACAKPYGAKVLINGDIALAQEIGADGVHLNAHQLMALNTRPEMPWCLATCHTEQMLAHAQKLGLDGVVVPTQTNQSQAELPLHDWAAFTNMIKENTLPVFASGHLQHANLMAAWQAGAHGIAVNMGED